MEAKVWWKSRTVWGLALLLLSLVLGHWWGVAVPTDEATVADVADLAAKIGEAVGLALALYGAVRAKGPKTLTTRGAEGINRDSPI